jgi:hypothetical protein
MDPSSWVEQQLLPTMVAHGRFGDRSKQRLENTKCKVTQTDTGYDHFISTIQYMNLEIEFEHQAPQAYSLLVKLSPEDPIFLNYFDTDFLFHNEIIMYTEIIPFVEEFLGKNMIDLLGRYSLNVTMLKVVLHVLVVKTLLFWKTCYLENSHRLPNG